jgi:predicted aminopeptidase
MVGYGLQAARGQWELSRKAQPIDAVIDSPASSEQLRAQLRTVRSVRRFAATELGLPDNASYTRYAALGRPYVVWNVVATPELSLAPRRWCFPVTGCISYRGYFSEQAARRFAGRQQRRGFDTMVGGVPAYSTLGYFEDPVPDTLLRYGELSAAETILHELAHQRLYVAGDSDFNEAFATVVASAGLRRWLLAEGRSSDLPRIAERDAVAAQFDALFARARVDLIALYASPRSVADQLQLKAARFERLRADLVDLQSRLGARNVYEEWLRAGLNNAHLAALATYRRCVDGLTSMLEQQSGGDLRRFYEAVDELARQPRPQREAAVCEAPALP